MPIHYRDIIVKSFRIMWHHKFLWFFGLFAALITGSVLQLFSSEQQWLIGWRQLEATGIFQINTVPRIVEAASADPAGFAVRVLALLVFAGIALFLVWLGVVSQGGLLWGTARLNDKKNARFSEVVETGRQRLWPILFLHIVQRIALWAVAAGMGAVVAMSIIQETLVIDLAATFALLLLLALTFVVAMTIRYALLYVAIDEQSFGASLRSAVQLWRQKPLLTVEAGILMFAIQVLAGFLFTLAFFALLIPWIFSLYALGQWNATGGIALLLVTGIAIFVVVAAVGGAVITVFRETLWSVFFGEIQKTDGRSVVGELIGMRPAKKK